MDSKELGVANWVWINGKPAGKGSDTLPEAWAYYLPIRRLETIKGVIGFHFESPEHALTPDNLGVIETITRLGALAIERIESQI
jgi:two-component system sensor histidine kinase KdpD